MFRAVSQSLFAREKEGKKGEGAKNFFFLPFPIKKRKKTRKMLQIIIPFFR